MTGPGMNIILFASLIVLLTCAVCGTANAQDLAGSRWQLVEIRPMNDTVETPETPGNYTIEFFSGGTVAIQADCNRGTGSWNSEAEGMVRFGPIAATRALCAPDSMSEAFLGQFDWVRSYTFDAGNLFLATMADGAVLEFEPSGMIEVTATVLGTELTATDEAELTDAILTRLFDQYARDEGISVEQPEIDRFIENLHAGKESAGLTSDENLTAEKSAQVDEMETSIASAMIRQWKINKSLYEKYGGRIIYQQMGPEPLDALRNFLESRQAEGAFEIRKQVLSEAFWRNFTDDTRHDFMDPDGADAKAAFSTPFWQ